MVSSSPTRSYNSTRRALQAAQTRADVLDAAMRLFRTAGWTGTTLAAVAEEAGVAIETVYKAFGSKTALLRAAMETAIVGDAEPVPFADRPEFLALGDGTTAERIARAASLVATIHERSAGIWLSVIAAAGGDADVDVWRIEMEQRRRVDVGRSAGQILDRAPDDLLVTMLWVLYGPETYVKLVLDSGMSRSDYERFLADATHRLLGD